MDFAIAPLAALALALAPAPLLDAVKAGSAAAAAPAVEVKQLVEMAKEIQARVEALRGQKLAKPLHMGVKNKAQITQFIQERLQEEYGPDKVLAEGQMLKLVGLLPDTMDYGGFLTQLLTEQVAGFYDHTRKELHIADWIPTLMQQPVMAHEIFHAVQDQEWGGGKLIDSKKYSHDAVLAHAALLEGDATLVMLMYSMPAAPGESPDVSPMTVNMIAAAIPLQMSSPEYPVMASAPDYLKQSLVFPYQQGMLFLSALRSAGWTWSDFRKLYSDPPGTTEQILHPERYSPVRDVPADVTMALPAGFKRTWDGMAGELHLRQMLLAQLPIDQATDAAAGWDGDFTALEVSGNRMAVEATLAWDSAADETAFVAALRKAHAARKPARPVSLELTEAGTITYMVFSEDAALAKELLATLPGRSKVTPH